jgi:hypothetical protein
VLSRQLRSNGRSLLQQLTGCVESVAGWAEALARRERVAREASRVRGEAILDLHPLTRRFAPPSLHLGEGFPQIRSAFDLKHWEKRAILTI